jgi:hypothetical protein
MSQKIFNVSTLAIFPTKPKGKHKMKFTLVTNSVDIISLTYIEIKSGWKLQSSKGLEPYSPDDSIKILNACNSFLNGKLTNPKNPDDPYGNIHVKKNPSNSNTSFTNSFQIIF